MAEIPEYDCLNSRTIREEIYPKAKPAIPRGVGSALEPVPMAANGPGEIADYLKRVVRDRLADVLSSLPNAGSTFFFDKDLSNLNFERGKMPFPEFADAVLSSSPDERMLYFESTSIAELSPELAKSLDLPCMSPGNRKTETALAI